MAQSLVSQGTIATCGWNETYPVTGLPTTQNFGSFQFNPTAFTSGTGAGQVNCLYTNSLSLTASGSTTITLTSYTDPLNLTLSMLRVKELWITLASGGASSVTIGNATHPLAIFSAGSTTYQLNTGGIFYICYPVDATGIAITAGSTDQLKIVNNDSGNAAVLNIQIKGCSA